MIAPSNDPNGISVVFTKDRPPRVVFLHVWSSPNAARIVEEFQHAVIFRRALRKDALEVSRLGMQFTNVHPASVRSAG